MKFGPVRDYWTEFVFEAYVNHRPDVIFLAVKPQQMSTVLDELTGHARYRIETHKLVISIAAGIRIRQSRCRQ